MKDGHTWILLAAGCGLLGWQEGRVREAREDAGAARRAAMGAEAPIQVDDSTTVTRGLEDVRLERDASIQVQQVKYQSGASSCRKR